MRLRAAAFLLLVAGCVAACASIWGFEDATADADGGRPPPDPEIVPAQGATGVVCVPQPPVDWQGPLIIDEEEELNGKAFELKDCPAPYANPVDAFDGLLAPTPACNCGCDPSNLTCAAPIVSMWATNNCGGTACGTVAAAKDCPATGNLPAPGCAAVGGASVKVTTPPALAPNAACKVKSDAVLPSRWTKGARVCAPPSQIPGTCPPNKVPTPAAPISYENNYCVATTDERDCPAGYPKRRVYYRDRTDTRECQCACGAPTGATCPSVFVSAYDNAATCTGGAKPLPGGSGCVALGGNNTVVVFDAGAAPGPTGGSCAPSGGPAGAAAKTKPTTICCRL